MGRKLREIVEMGNIGKGCSFLMTDGGWDQKRSKVP